MSTLKFEKPYILVTRIGENLTNDTYHNPVQKYYQFEHMNILFKYASRYMMKEEMPVSALRIIDAFDTEKEVVVQRSEYFHDFPTALQEYRDGTRR